MIMKARCEAKSPFLALEEDVERIKNVKL